MILSANAKIVDAADVPRMTGMIPGISTAFKGIGNVPRMTGMILHKHHNRRL